MTVVPRGCEVKRDPIGRRTLMRLAVTSRSPCSECGEVKARGKNRLFKYGWHEDGVHTKANYVPGAFCCLSCYKIHTGDDFD